MADDLVAPVASNLSRIKILRMTLISNDGTEHEVQNLVRSFIVYEDMFSSFLTATMVFFDGNDMIRTAPIIGKETVMIEFMSPYSETPVKLEFLVYGVGEVTDSTLESQVYALKLISKSGLASITKLICKSFNNMSVSDIVAALVQEINVESKKVEIDITAGKHSFIAPNVEVNEAISMLIPRSKHKNYASGSAFVYFEDLDRIVYGSMEAMYDKEPVLDLSDAVKNLMGKEEADSFLGFENKSIDVMFDMLNMVEKGAFSNVCTWFDPVSKAFGETSYSYNKDYDKTTHAPGIDKEKKVSFRLVDATDYTSQPSRAFLIPTYNNSKQIPYIKDKPGSLNLSTGEELTIPFRTAQINQMLSNLKIRLKLIGNEKIRVGETVMVNIRSSGNDKENSKNVLISGVYLVTAVKRTLMPFYEITIEISRDSYAEDHKAYLETIKRDAQR